MAKIKSTLDLVMERTKGLSMTEDDKLALKTKEWTEKARGWVQMLLDRNLSLHELRKEFAAGSAVHSRLDDVLRRELLDRIDPDADNGIIFQALAEILGFDVSPLRETLAEYQRNLAQIEIDHGERLRLELQAKGISGTSVVPNISVDEAWIADAKALKDRFRQGVRAV